MDKVFVITVCRNARELLEPTMLSVLNQTYDHISYIVVDGASTDGTVEIIRKYEKRLAAWVSEPDKGIYDAMNKGVEIARSLLDNGEDAWVNFMNAGDRFSDAEVVSDIFKTKVAEDTKVIVGHFYRCNGNKKELCKTETVDYLPVWMPFCHQATFIKIDSCLFDTKYKIAADYDLFYNLYFDYGRNTFLIKDRVIADFQMDGSTTYSNLRTTKKEILKIQSRHKSWFWLKELTKWILHRK